MVSMYLNFGLSLGLTPSTSMSNTVLVIWLSSLRLTCPYQRSRFCIRCVTIGWTVAASLISSFLLCSLRSTPCIHRNILISVLFISISSFFFIVQHSTPYVIVGFITVLYIYILCLSLTGIFLSQMTPVISLHLFQASRTLFLQSVVEPPSASNIDPRYLKVVTLLISSSPSLTLLSWHEDGGRYSVLLLLTRSPLFSIALLHNSSCSSGYLRVFSHNTKSSANNIAWGGPLPTSCDITSIIMFMLIRWSKIKTQLGKKAGRFQHTLFMLRIMSALCLA